MFNRLSTDTTLKYILIVLVKKLFDKIQRWYLLMCNFQPVSGNFLFAVRSDASLKLGGNVQYAHATKLNPHCLVSHVFQHICMAPRMKNLWLD